MIQLKLLLQLAAILVLFSGLAFNAKAQSFSGGTISNPTQTIDHNTAPAQINATAASGCSGISYYWTQSTDGQNFTDIPGANGQNYQPEF